MDDDRALERLLKVQPQVRANAFERESKGQSMGINDRLVEHHNSLRIPEGQEQQQRNATKNYWNGVHERNKLDRDLRLD